MLGEAEQLGGRAVERFDFAVLADRDDPVRHVLEHGPRVGLAVAEPSLRMVTSVNVARDRDFRKRSAKIETFARRLPGTSGANMKSTAPLAYAIGSWASSRACAR